MKKTNVNKDFRLLKEIFPGVPQGSIFGPILFNIYNSDIFLFVDETFLSNYADDTALTQFKRTTPVTNLFLRIDQK